MKCASCEVDTDNAKICAARNAEGAIVLFNLCESCYWNSKHGLYALHICLDGTVITEERDPNMGDLRELR